MNRWGTHANECRLQEPYRAHTQCPANTSMHIRVCWRPKRPHAGEKQALVRGKLASLPEPYLPGPTCGSHVHTRAQKYGRDDQTSGMIPRKPTKMLSPAIFCTRNVLRCAPARRGCSSRIVAESTSFPAMVNFGESGQGACTRTTLLIKNSSLRFFKNSTKVFRRRRWRRRRCFVGGDRLFVPEKIRKSPSPLSSMPEMRKPCAHSSTETRP